MFQISDCESKIHGERTLVLSGAARPCVSITAGVKGSEGQGVWRRANCTGTAHAHIHSSVFRCERHLGLINNANKPDREYRGLRIDLEINNSDTKMGQISVRKAIPIVQNQLSEYGMDVCVCVSSCWGPLFGVVASGLKKNVWKEKKKKNS